MRDKRIELVDVTAAATQIHPARRAALEVIAEEVNTFIRYDGQEKQLGYAGMEAYLALRGGKDDLQTIAAFYIHMVASRVSEYETEHTTERNRYAREG
jgi:hypothetical protein